LLQRLLPSIPPLAQEATPDFSKGRHSGARLPPELLARKCHHSSLCRRPQKSVMSVTASPWAESLLKSEGREPSACSARLPEVDFRRIQRSSRREWKFAPYLSEQEPSSWLKISNHNCSQWAGREKLFERERERDPDFWGWDSCAKACTTGARM
jgi:hypothetical protein